MQVLQILSNPPSKLGQPKSLGNYNTHIVNIKYKCPSLGQNNFFTTNYIKLKLCKHLN